MQDAAGSYSVHTTPGGTAFVGHPPSGAIHLDAQGVITHDGGFPDVRCGMRYASLFDDADRLRGLPEQLLRLAARHGTVRDEVVRTQPDGRAQWVRLEVRAIRDEAHGLSGFEERRIATTRGGALAFLDGLDSRSREAIKRAHRELANSGATICMGIVRTNRPIARAHVLLLQDRHRAATQRLLTGGSDCLVLLTTAQDDAAVRRQLQDVAEALRRLELPTMRILEVAVWTLRRGKNTAA